MAPLNTRLADGLAACRAGGTSQGVVLVTEWLHRHSQHESVDVVIRAHTE